MNEENNAGLEDHIPEDEELEDSVLEEDTLDDGEQEDEPLESPEPEASEQESEEPETGGVLKIVIATRNGRTVMSAAQSGADPYLEPAPGDDLEDLAAALPDFVRRAREHWSLNPRNPEHFRPKPAPGKRSAKKTGSGSKPKESTGPAPTAPREGAVESPLLL